jgi:hypothetical protein
MLGELMNNNSIRVKSLIYEGMNLWMMLGGRRRRAARRAFKSARKIAATSSSASLLQLVDAAELWCEAQLHVDTTSSYGACSSVGALVAT